MANKQQQTGGAGGKKKVQDPFAKKEWFDIKAPDYFNNKKVGKMPVNKSAGARNAEDDLKGRVVEVNLADLQGKEGDSYRKIKLRVEDVQGRYALTNFYGMDFTTDKLRSLIKKWQTLIEAHVEAKTTDGYYLRLFAIGFTKKREGQQKKTCYAQTSQVKAIRAKMREIMLREATSCSLRELVLKFIPEAIGNSIERECTSIYPLSDVYIRKVKLLQSPKFDPQVLRDLHDKKGMPDVGVAVEEAPAAAEEGEKKTPGTNAKETKADKGKPSTAAKQPKDNTKAPAAASGKKAKAPAAEKK